jgi:hypothetical protein
VELLVAREKKIFKEIERENNGKKSEFDILPEKSRACICEGGILLKKQKKSD